MKRIRTLSGLALLMPFLAIADKIDYSANEDGIQISYVIENLYQEESLLSPGTTKFMIENFGVLEADNYPSLLQKIESFQIPEGKKVGNISYTAETDTLKCSCVPSTPVHFDGAPTPLGEIKPYVGTWPSANVVEVESNSYRGNTIGKIAVAPLQYNYEKGEVYFAKTISINIPFVQNGVKNTRSFTQVQSSSTTKGNLEQFLTISNSALSSSIDEEIITENEISPYAITLPSLNLGTVAPTLLIVTPDEFKEEAEKFAETKSRLGYSVVIESASTEILKEPTEVFKIIKRAYDWYGNVEHVLLFGGGNKIAAFKGEKSVKIDGSYIDYYTDFYYSCLDAEHQDLIDDPYCLEEPDYMPNYSISEQDRFADVTLGRFPAQSLTEIQNLVNKSISYEMNPPVDDPNYFTSSIYFSESTVGQGSDKSDDYVFVQSVEKLDEQMNLYAESSHSSLPTALKYYYVPDTNNIPLRYKYGTSIPNSVQSLLMKGVQPSEIIESVNAGSSILLYRGHGNRIQWSHCRLSNTDIETLTNYNKYPGIFAITCLSGMFYHKTMHPEGFHSLCEDFLIKKNKGAAFAICANRESLSGLNEYLMAGIYNAMYPGVIAGFTIPYSTNTVKSLYPATSELGTIFQRAENTMTMMEYDTREWFRTASESVAKEYHQYNKEVFHCLGDPTLKVYRFKPQKYYPTILKMGKSLRVFHQGRKLVAKRKGQHEAVFFPPATGDYYDIADLVDSFDLSLIGEGYVPVFINSEGLTSTTATPDLKIESVSNYGSRTKISYNSDNEEVNFKLYDIYGNLIDETDGDNGNAYLKSIDAFSVVVMEKDGVVVDSKRIINK